MQLKRTKPVPLVPSASYNLGLIAHNCIKLHHYLKDSKVNIALVAQTIMKYGDTDKKRKRGCGRILNFGVNGDYGTTTKETITVKVRVH